MKVGYLRSAAQPSDADSVLRAFEEIGCERIVFDSPASFGGGEGSLPAILSRLKTGDVLVVWKMDCVASSLDRLIELVLDLSQRGIVFESLSDGLKIDKKSSKPVLQTLSQFWKFESERREYLRAHGARHCQRVGRPKALSEDDVERACRQVVNHHRPIEAVARELGVSRATLYRYLGMRR